MTVEAAVLDLQSKLLALSGMKAAPDYPPETAAPFPFGVSYEASATTEMGSFTYPLMDDRATIISEIHVSRVILPKAIKLAYQFRDLFLEAILDDGNLSDSVAGVTEIRRTFGRLEWGGIETIGYRFEIDVVVLWTG